MTRILAVSSPGDPAISEAAGVLRAGGLVAFPTETVYGLGADGLNVSAVARIYAAKGRPATNPLILHVADREDARGLVADWTPEADRLARRFWPGPLTLVLPAGEAVPAIVRAGGPTVALRCPAHPVALALIRAAGRPLAAPSANRSQHLSPTTARHVETSLGGIVDCILDAGPTSAGLESTILDLRPPFRSLRPGPISPSDLEALGGAVGQGPGVLAPGAPQPAPGMAARHYAPRAKLELVLPGTGLHEAGRGSAYVSLGALPPLPEGVHGVAASRDPVELGASLYALLHTLDDAGFHTVFFELPPPEEAWLAVRDRLLRASTREGA
ncbi:MAG: threonylcarbamoyl-AMP synthase [Acidobacteria bacterium]|nr:threonylcarbamoyl-AMP synthase [Acidobacteriota bacterium]